VIDYAGCAKRAGARGTPNQKRLNIAGRRPALLGLLCLLVVVTAGAAERPPAFAVASAHPLATRAGIEILQEGGNAFDAAVAVTAALAVVEPYSSGLGGGGFWLLHRASDGRDIMVDGRERAPLAAGPSLYLDEHGAVIPRLSLDGALAAAIPGVPAAMAHLAEHYGRLPLARSLAPALRYAREGFPVDARYRRLAQARLDALRRSPEASSIFLVNGEPPAEGSLLRQGALAKVIERVARHGRDGFYSGPTASALIEGVRAAGGIWTAQDLADYQVVERPPVRGNYRGMSIICASPPSSGGIALITMLNILSGYDLGKLDDVTQKHLIIEAMRRAYRDRAQYLGDPDFVHIPEELTSPAYAFGLRNGIRLDRATPSAMLPGAASGPVGSDTTHFSILDREGNAVAATLSINLPFGAAFVPPDTGVLLNNEMDDFSSKPGAPNAYGLIGYDANAIAGGKRPLSSMTPTILDDGRRMAAIGTPGGSRIITMVLLAALQFAAGEEPESWGRTPRFHHQFMPDVVVFEPGALSREEISGLQARGHTLKELDDTYGNMQSVMWDRVKKRVLAASDPRGIGSAEVR
jgi:gamma-glutamyltranspeptidase/glutathione hydrolase